jgi:hypothetical protein
MRRVNFNSYQNIILFFVSLVPLKIIQLVLQYCNMATVGEVGSVEIHPVCSNQHLKNCI